MNWEKISGWCWTTAMVSSLVWLVIGIPYSGTLAITATLATVVLPFPKWRSFNER